MRESRDDVLIPVELLIPEGANPDITADPVAFAFIPGGLPLKRRPVDADFTAGFWIRAAGQTLAGITVGPGGTVTLDGPGTYAIVVKVTDDPTAPIVAPDWIEIQ